MLPIFVLLLSNLGLQLVYSQDEFPTVTLSQGAVKGQRVNSSVIGPYYCFLGIPYAKPPIGELRFKAPLDPDQWEGTLEALKEGNVCMQIDPATKHFKGDEDCLFINVYTPEFPVSSPLKPVMVWIYGGGFKMGSGNKMIQGPEYLLNAGVVYVSFNYRLGVFGFLSTEDSAAPGNAGLKDQVQALRWVQKNIEAFGGDPNKVTIFGESAGGASVQYHMISPMSKGLFQGAIAMSGSVINPWALAKKPKENAFFLGEALGTSASSSEELVKALRNEDSMKLMKTSHVKVSAKDNSRLVNMIFLPAVEPEVAGEGSFLPDKPLHLLEKGRIQDVPYMTGITTDEGIFLLSTFGILSNSSKIKEINDNFEEVFKGNLRFCYDDACDKDVFSKIKTFYFEDKDFTNSTLDKFIQFTTDFYFVEGVIEATNLMSSQIKSPIYMYQFAYDGGLAFLKKVTGTGSIAGVCHADELGYIFEIPFLSSNDELDLKTRSRMITLLTNFAKTGNPVPGSTDDIPIWPPYTSSETDYLDIGSRLVVKNTLIKERMEFWQKLYKSIRS